MLRLWQVTRIWLQNVNFMKLIIFSAGFDFENQTVELVPLETLENDAIFMRFPFFLTRCRWRDFDGLT